MNKLNHSVASPSIPPCPAAGTGVHSWILSAANKCRNAGVPAEEAEVLIAERMTRPSSPPNEVRAAIKKAYSQSGATPSLRVQMHFPAKRPPMPITEIKYDPDKLRAVADRISRPPNWRHWLWERSPKRPEAMNAFSFLAHLYQPGEIVQVFDNMETKSPVVSVKMAAPMDCRVPGFIQAGGQAGRGIWYLCNPVDGQWHDTGEKDDNGNPDWSCRNWQAVTSYRYAVLESDQAPADWWLAFIAQLPLCISAIYTSGGRSIHCLVRLDAPSKEAWDAAVKPLKRPLKVLGADPGCLSAVRLTRLPGCWRPEKGGFQKLLYLSPNPPEARLIDLPVLRTRFESLDRWRNLCPRWNRIQEANQ